MEFKEKLFGAGGALSSTASILGSYQLCHSLCLSAITLLSLIGITVTGMPLLFLTKLAVPFWIAGASLFVVMTGLAFLKEMHVSNKLMLANAGLLFAGVPFETVAVFQKFFWLGGAIIVISSIVWALADRTPTSCCSANKNKNDKKKTK